MGVYDAALAGLLLVPLICLSLALGVLERWGWKHRAMMQAHERRLWAARERLAQYAVETTHGTEVTFQTHFLGRRE